MRTLILLSAIPGSGKSTWAKQYQSTHPNTFVVSSDSIRGELFGNESCFKDEALVWKTYLERLNEHVHDMKELTVIADATHLTNQLRKMYYDLTPDFDRHVLVIFKIPYEISLYQNAMRERVVPREVMERLKSDYQEPDEEIISSYDEIEYITDFFSPQGRKLDHEIKEPNQ